MMASTSPYRLQIFLTPEIRKALRDVAHQEETSIQKLVTTWLVEKLRQHPCGQGLSQADQTE
jgi:hypothetical protein